MQTFNLGDCQSQIEDFKIAVNEVSCDSHECGHVWGRPCILSEANHILFGQEIKLDFLLQRVCIKYLSRYGVDHRHRIFIQESQELLESRPFHQCKRKISVCNQIN